MNCCKNETNLKTIRKNDGTEVKQCSICGRKHYVMQADVGKYDTTGKGL